MFNSQHKFFWNRGSKPSKHHTALRDALRNYIDIIYKHESPEIIEKAYNELKQISPGIEKELNLLHST